MRLPEIEDESLATVAEEYVEDCITPLVLDEPRGSAWLEREFAFLDRALDVVKAGVTWRSDWDYDELVATSWADGPVAPPS